MMDCDTPQLSTPPPHNPESEEVLRTDWDTPQLSPPPPNSSEWEELLNMDWENPPFSPPPPYTPEWEELLSTSLLTSVGESRYDFRSAPRESLTSVTTWVDQDESGDYDPSGKQVSQVHLPRKRIERTERDEDDIEVTKKPKHNTWQRGRLEGKSCYVVLKLHSEHGKERLKELSKLYPDNRHDYHFSDTDDSDQSTNSWSHMLEYPGTDGTLQAIEPFRLLKHYCNSSITPASKVREHFSVGDVTLGYPAARGCKACLELRIECSLLQEGAMYPCAACMDDRIDCELILQPLQKRPCESCRYRRISCSYRQAEADHSLPCQQCADSLRNCCAGPASGRIRTGPSLDQKVHEGRIVDSPRIQSGTKGPTSQRPFVTCTQCRRDKKWCTLSGKSEEIPCGRCLSAKRNCTFEPIVKNIGSTTRSRRKELPLQEPVATEGVGVTKVIKTSLVHPIMFNHFPPEDGSAPCHWCEDLAYGILGIGQATVEVIDFGDHQGYNELEGGHFGRGFDSSRMCMDCTMERLFITSCKPHEIERLEDMETEGFDYDATFTYLFPGKAAKAPFKWCSICPRAAFFACCKPHMAIEDDGEIWRAGRNGCGLHLCEECAVALMTEHDGFLEERIEVLQRNNADFMVRADVDFLHQDGELQTRAPYFT